MPIYEYHCDNCGCTFEEMESINSEQAEKPCPECKAAAKRLISQSAFHLKGSGWYTSDYKNKPACPSKKTDSPACAGCANAVEK